MILSQTSTLPVLKLRRDETIIIRRFSGEFELPARALIRPRPIWRQGKLYCWLCDIILDDEKVQLEAESFFKDVLPKVWYEIGFNSLAETTPENLLSDCFADYD